MYGYPAATAAGINSAINYTSTSFNVTYAGSVATYTVAGATTPATCSVTYTAPAASGSAGIVGTPLTGGC